MSKEYKTAKEWYENNYLSSFPNDFLSWVEGFADQLDVPYPDPIDDALQMGIRIGAYETQMIILNKLRYAVKVERDRQKVQ